MDVELALELGGIGCQPGTILRVNTSLLVKRVR